MIIHHESLMSIAFGDQHHSFARSQFYSTNSSYELAQKVPLRKMSKLLGCEQIITLKQIHSNNGFVVTNTNFEPYLHEGDFLITTQLSLALGIATADCLPIIFFDSSIPLIAIAHAGWQGSVKEIALKVTKTMQEQFSSNLDYVKIFFGPSAKTCCYHVGDEFLKNFESFDYASECFQLRKDGYFFDLPLFNRLQLKAAGISQTSFHLDYNICTICNPHYCSYRRDGEQTLRQMTMVMLK